MTTSSATLPLRATDILVRAAIVALALGTAYIHSTLGGLLFTLNAIGYVVLALAMVIPLGIAGRFQSLVRVALIGYAFATILGWAIDGPFYGTAYMAKAIELALIVLLAIDIVRFDGRALVHLLRNGGPPSPSVPGGAGHGQGGAR